jgi:ferric-dicitrate binding protein FerR (iron transport regulator)
MVFNQERILFLLKNYTDRKATPEEQRELMDWLANYDDNGSFRAHIQQLFDDYRPEQRIEGVDWERIYASILLKRNASQPAVHRVHFLKTSWFRYAAAVVLVAGGTAIWWEISRSPQTDGTTVTTIAKNQDIQPGSHKAILTIGNNRPIDLSSSKTGIAVSSAITYTDGEKIANAGEQLTLATPRGGQYQAVLPDGSKVWLNAASSIRFPSRFSGAKREVEISGEVYIEVAKNSRQPFYVTTRKTNIQVLGTSFNVNAYEDEESEKTTLVEGSVRVVNNSAFVRAGYRQEERGIILKPGQQSIYTGNSPLTTLNADIEQALAWKNGLFNFNNLPLQQVLRQLSRWYDIDVEYQKNIPSKSFSGEIQRDLSLSEVLDVLKDVGVNFTIQGKKLIVRP